MENETVKKVNYSDYEWPENNEGWFTGVYSLNGRWRRREFLLVTIPAAIVAGLYPHMLVVWVYIAVTLAVSAKRLHDMNMTSKFCFILIATWILGFFIATSIGMDLAMIATAIQFTWYIVLGVWPGSKGINTYGSNPRRDYEEQCVEIGLPRLSDCK